MLEDIRAISSTDRDIQNFSRTVGGVGILLGVFSFFAGGHNFPFFFLAGGVLTLGGELMPRALVYIQLLWMMIAIVMGWVMTRVILAVLFYGIMTPIGFGMRLVGKRPLDIRWDRGQKTYWKKREDSVSSRESHEQPF